MRSFLVLALLLTAAPALAQVGAIAQGTPSTFAAPATITHWDPKVITFEPGPNARIYVEIVARGRPDVVLSFEYPRDCGSFGSTVVDGKTVPNPPTCPLRDTSAEINAALGVINGRNYSGGNPRLWQFILTNICLDFATKFPGGCVVQP